MKVVSDSGFNERCGAMARQFGTNLYDAVLYDNGTAYRYEHQKANLCNNSYSVAKMFCMTAIGMLVDAGKLSEEDRITSVLAGEIHAAYDPNWDQVTVAHALAHKMGIRGMYLDIDSDDVDAYGTQDYLAVSLRENLIYEPGTHYAYSDAAYYLLSRVIMGVSGERLDDFLLRRLFTPLGFAEMAWSKCPYGYPMGATGLYCRTEDMVKLGVVFLNGGMFEGKRYLSEKWVQTAIAREFGITRSETRCYCKTGVHGQVIAFCPETGKALAIHGFDCGDTGFQGAAIREFLET